MVLACYGLREAQDTDFLCHEACRIETEFENINTHDEELKYYQESKHELIYNPQNHFYYNDLKFIAFDRLFEMKKNRNEEKDRNDCEMMEALIENNRLKNFIAAYKQHILYLKIKSRAKLMSILKSIGVYDMLKTLIRGTK
jgi:hypothetical protein